MVDRAGLVTTLANDPETSVQVTLYNLTGQEILQTTDHQFTQSVKYLTPGVYIVRLEDLETGKQATKKVLVQ